MSSLDPVHVSAAGHGYRKAGIDDAEAYNHSRRYLQLQDFLHKPPEQTTYIRSSPPSYIDGEDVGDRFTETDQFMEHVPRNLNWRRRVKHFTWVFFTVPLATGGIANVIKASLDTIGYIFFILNLIFFVTVSILITVRFAIYPRTFRASFIHPTESLFIPASIISFSVILLNLSQYGMALNDALIALFWFDCALAIIGSVGIYLVLWSTQTFTVAQMTPIWIFPAYPLLIIGPHAGVLSSAATPARALEIIVGGVALQGVGFMVSLMIYSAFIYRLMTQKLPTESLRPAMFVSVGPSAFTVAGLVTMAANLQRAVPDDFMTDGPRAAFILRVIANFAGVWLWGLSIWFFLVSVFAHYSCVNKSGRFQFAMSWYSFVFPNTALVTATLAIGDAFGSHSIQVLGTVMAVMVIILWFIVFIMMIRAVKLKHILWPHMGEDKDEGGFKRSEMG
ncbi:MAG: hypothetical protein M1829_004404 [Trizodia sp. TS-e1964]|nr:MAG: hypothetical protein M1829_004404 [Trizodia sp. TS-e1964]